MFVDLTGSDGNGMIYFNMLPPASDGVAIYSGSMNCNAVILPLPETWRIRLDQIGNDRDTGRRSDFNLELSSQ